MSDAQTNATRDMLVNAVPGKAHIVLHRDAVVQKWCDERGIAKDDLTLDQILEIRKLPEWKNAD